MGLNLSPNLALLVYSVFIFCLFWADRRRELPVSSSLWLPMIWMALAGSRTVGLWFAMAGLYSGSGHFEEGNPAEAVVYLVLIFAGVFILFQRKEKFNLSGLIAANWPLFLLLGYYALAILWSDFPFVSFKRYVKFVGVLIMISVILTEHDPILALRTAARRCGFILLPLSIVLIKYFDAGVEYDEWSGERMVIGVAEDKNMLGQVCLVFGLIYSWDIMLQLKERFSKGNRLVLIIDLFLLLLAVYLLLKAHSATSLVCLAFGSVVLFATGYTFVLKRIGLYIIIGSLTLLILNYYFDLYTTILVALKRDPTLTGRTDIWKLLLSLAGNPWFGTGYESFWTGSRVLKIWETHHINEAHNGFLDIYLNTGLVGLSLFSIFLLSTYRRCREIVRLNLEYGRFAMAFFFTALLYNCAEAAFKGRGFLFFVFLTIGLRLAETNNERVVYGVRVRAPGLPADRAL
jgi:exopolysaccharide production protein ExoQ